MGGRGYKAIRAAAHKAWLGQWHREVMRHLLTAYYRWRTTRKSPPLDSFEHMTLDCGQMILTAIVLPFITLRLGLVFPLS